MNDQKTLFGSAFVYTFTNALSAGVPFLMVPVLTRVLSPAEYGQTAMFLVVVSILSAVAGLSVHGAVGIKYFYRDEVDFPRYVASCVTILVVSTSATMLLVALASPLLQAATKLPREWLLCAVGVAGAQFLIQTQLAVWQSAKKAWRFGAFRIVQTLLDAAISLYFVLFLGLAWQGRVGGFALAVIAMAGIALVLMLRDGWMKFPPRKDYVVNALRFGVPLVPHAIGGMLIALIDRFLISNVLDVASTGIYMVALQIGMVLGITTDSFNRAYAPWLIESLKDEKPDRDIRIVRFTYLYFIVVIAVAAVLGVAAPLILPIIAGTDFRAASSIVIYISLGFAFGGMYYMVANYIFFAGKTAALAVITFISGLINVAGCYWLLHRNGVIGAAQAFMIAQAILFVCTWMWAHRSRPMPWRKALWSTRVT